MIIDAINPYSVTMTMDVLQCAAVMQTLHMALEMGLDEDVAERMQKLGTEISSTSVVNQVAQVVDSIARAVNMEPFQGHCTCCEGEGTDIEADGIQEEDAKPVAKPN